MKFHHIYIEIVNYCQFNCSFCPKTKRNPKALTVDEFTYILDQVRPFTDTIYLHVLGEPLLHESLDTFLEIAQAKGFTVNITTNGLLLKEKGDILLKYPNIRKINISIHALDDIGNASINKQEYMKNLLAFVPKAVANNSTIIYRLWSTDKENDTMYSYIKEAYPNVDLENEVSPQNGIRLDYRIFLHQANQFVWPIRSHSDHEDGYCLGLKTHIAILSNGTVVPCCLDNDGTIALGNIFETPLETILQSELATSIKTGFQSHQAIHDLCKSCSYKDRFTNE